MVRLLDLDDKITGSGWLDYWILMTRLRDLGG